MVHKTKKYNRFKKNNDIKRRYTKKQNYYGGSVKTMNKINNLNNTLQESNDAIMYGPAGTYNYSGNMVAPQDTQYKDHDTGLLNDVGKGLNYVGSTTASLNEGIQDFNKKTDDVKESIGDGLDKVATGAFEIVKDTVSDVANLVDLDDLKQASVASSIMIDAMEEPVVEATKVLSQVGEQLAANAGTSAMNVLIDIAAAAPGIGALIELPKIANDAVYGLAKGVEAGAQLIDIAGDIVDATEKNVDKTIETLKKIEETGNYALQDGVTPGKDQFDQFGQPGFGTPGYGTPGYGSPGLGSPGLGSPELPLSSAQTRPKSLKGGFKNFTKQKAQIGGRISESISEFSDPIGYQSSILKGGNNKTKKSFIKNVKAKSRRVHFSL
jgi:hypothetical protein